MKRMKMGLGAAAAVLFLWGAGTAFADPTYSYQNIVESNNGSPLLVGGNYGTLATANFTDNGSGTVTLVLNASDLYAYSQSNHLDLDADTWVFNVDTTGTNINPSHLSVSAISGGAVAPSSIVITKATSPGATNVGFDNSGYFSFAIQFPNDSQSFPGTLFQNGTETFTITDTTDSVPGGLVAGDFVDIPNAKSIYTAVQIEGPGQAYSNVEAPSGLPLAPEPSCLAGLLSLGGIGLIGLVWRRRQSAA